MVRAAVRSSVRRWVGVGRSGWLAAGYDWRRWTRFDMYSYVVGGFWRWLEGLLVHFVIPMGG